jgi:hypothetical protein
VSRPTDDEREDGDGVDAALRGLGEAPPLPPLGAALEAELAGLAPRAPRRPWRDYGLVVVLSAVYAAAILAIAALRQDLHALPPLWLAGYAAAWLVGFGVLGYLAIVPRRGAVMPRTRSPS